GNINFELVDVAEAVTDTFRDELTDNDNGLRGKTVELYLGYKDLAWTDYRLEQTQVIDKSVTYIDGIYKVSCRDIQREARKQIFELPKTRLAAAVSVSDSSIDVHDTSGFTLVPHGTSYTLNPSVSIVYFKIKAGDGFEICSATGMTATSFTGVVRGLFGTDNLTHEIGDNESSSPEVTEYIYLEMPAVKLVYALLTGDLIGQGATLPDHYHIGISADWVDIDAFTGIGELYDSSDDTLGLLTRFQGLTKTDGKRFVEQQLLLLAGCVTPVLPNGKLSLKVVGSVLTGAAYAAELNETNIVKYSALNYDLSAIKNQLEIFWSWLELQNGEKDYYRINRVVDLVSIERFGETIEKPLKFLGLHGERHTTSIIDKMFDVFRDRSAGAAARLSLDVLPSMNNIEVGDVVRVSLDALRDHTGLNTFDRAMEVQGITIDQLSQSVKLQLFGSTQQAGIIESGDITTLPDEWYCDEDFTEMTELSTVLTINGSNQVTANGTITGDNSAPGGGSSTTDYIARWSFDQIVGGGGLGENDLQDGRDLMIVDASDYDPLAPGSVQCLRTTGD
ncbi:MAG: hypothetical protein GY941_09425, partial [Planctomycetes bacterium]|nr:hypothetical protein [Planctomycetota bacterium]